MNDSENTAIAENGEINAELQTQTENIPSQSENALLISEIAVLQKKIDELMKKIEEIAAARAKLPEFAVKTQYSGGKYDDIKNVFRKK